MMAVRSARVGEYQKRRAGPNRRGRESGCEFVYMHAGPTRRDLRRQNELRPERRSQCMLFYGNALVSRRPGREEQERLAQPRDEGV